MDATQLRLALTRRCSDRSQARVVLSAAAATAVCQYFDYIFGVDRADNQADDRALVDGSVSPREVLCLAAGCLLTALGTMVVLANKMLAMEAAAPKVADGALSPLQSFLALVFCGVFLAYSYTGWPFGLKYRRLGDVAIFLCFGPLLVEGVHFVQVGRLSAEAMWLSVPIGLTTEAILHANNARDIDIDLAARARTLANAVGFNNSYRIFQALYAAAFATLPIFAWHYQSLLFLLPSVMLLQLPQLFAAFRSHDPKKTDGNKALTRVADICDRCGQFSFAFGALLAVAIVLG